MPFTIDSTFFGAKLDEMRWDINNKSRDGLKAVNTEH